MTDLAIRVQKLSKRYRLGAARPYKTLRDSIAEAARAPLGLIRGRRATGPDNGSEVLWALRDVSFDVAKGEVLGVIGRNGAGKSTLLKILSRITDPTQGAVELVGRVGSLLEVGTGFHPELTGRENVYLNGAILGMKRAEIASKFDEIVAFAETERFLDTAVKYYSSGMYMRLAFAVAAHLEPEILVVDEVLAVGDAAFQKKCLGKMGEVAKEGRTVLFVSHNMAAIEHFCSRVVVLASGRVGFAGDTRAGLRYYLEASSTAARELVDLSTHVARRPGSTPLLRSVRFLDRHGNTTNHFFSGDEITIEFIVDPLISLSSPQFGIGFDDLLGVRVFSLATYLSGSELATLKVPSRVQCKVRELPLTPGRYLLSLSAGSPENPLIDALDCPVSIEIEHADVFGMGKKPEPYHGRVFVRSQWSTTTLHDALDAGGVLR